MKLKNIGPVALFVTTLSSGCSAASIVSEQSLRNEGKVYTFESDGNGFNTKNFFYDNGQEVVAFDTQFTPDLAQQSIDYLRTQTSNPITYVVITHPNPDKFNGMSVFQRLGAKVVASRRTAQSMSGVHEYKKYFFVNLAKMFTDESYPKLSQVDIQFDAAYDLKLGNGEIIKLTELRQAGVSSNQTIASIPALSSVVVGDLVHHKAHAWLEGGIVGGKATPSIKGWIADLQELNDMFKDAPETIVLGGRGEAVAISKAVSAQIKYLNKADRIVTAYVNNLGSRRSELQSDQAGQHYQALQEKFEKAFPDYTLGYMIRYGVYGLVNSKL